MDNNFHHVKEALHRDNCDYLTDFLKKCIDDGTAVRDEQCPKSWSVFRHPILETLLEQFLPRMESETGKKLFPTYAYARHYQEGESLKCHMDRPSCEYSATITLGFDKDVWHLYIGDQGDEDDIGIVGEEGEIFKVTNVHKINMDVGDAVIYKGCDSPHWRYKFDESTWQTQVFLHYVDQDGPNAEWKFDKRPKLSHHENSECNQQNQEILYWYVPDAIAESSCDQMISKFESIPQRKAEIGGEESPSVDLTIRDVNKIDITPDIGIGATMVGMGMNINSKSWKFDVTHGNQTEFLRYDEHGHYKTHVDTFLCPNQKDVRKITVLAFLNDDFEGGKLYLENGDEKIYPPQGKGTVVAFPSFVNHGVEPVTSGIRRSIVTWLVGPWFK